MISAIAVIGNNRELGCDNKLLWDLPEDMARFKELTMGHPVIMGRKTFESIGKPLPGRTNIIISRNKDFKADGCIIEDSIESSIESSKNSPGSEEVFIIGGAEIYNQALPYTNKLYLTVVDDKPDADVYFPNYSEFTNILCEEGQENDNYKFKFVEITK